jgi:hypothetical protein
MTLRRFDGVAFLDRLRIVQTPWFGVYLHRMDGPDPGRHLHDHPWPFVSIVLRGGYREWRFDTRVAAVAALVAREYPKAAPGYDSHRRQWSIARMRPDECHSIYSLDRSPTWTLMFVGRRFRNWGFYTPDGWMPHGRYDTDLTINRNVTQVDS